MFEHAGWANQKQKLGREWAFNLNNHFHFGDTAITNILSDNTEWAKIRHLNWWPVLILTLVSIRIFLLNVAVA